MDTFSVEKRSVIMRSIKGFNTTPELCVRKYLFNRGFRYSLHKKNLPGTPDMVLKKYKTVIFINGCFWHGHEGCIKASLPKTRVEFWKNKIVLNKARDISNIDKLIRLGWKVIVIFQCELKTKHIGTTMSKVIEKLLSFE